VAPDGKALPVLNHIKAAEESAIYLLKDFATHGKDATVHRTLRELLAGAARRATLVLVDFLPLPDELRRFAVNFELPWPTAEELELTIRETFQRIRDESVYDVTSKITKREVEQLAQILRGLSCAEAGRVVASAILDDMCLSSDDIPRIIQSKRKLLASAGRLEAVATSVRPEDIGGLANLKKWLQVRKCGFSRQAREFGMQAPRGILILGVPGTGKSLAAKAVAAEWNMALVKLDPGTLYQKYIGETESQLRQALAQAEAMSPVVLWIDEIEKAFASATSSMSDGGLSMRMFGTLLSWMQDHRYPIFCVATANDIESLPPELMRKGRFDEVFFVDLPRPEARAEILAIHMRQRNRAPEKFDLHALAHETEGFTGSELEQIVVGALFAAFHDKVELTNRHLSAEIAKTRPLSVLMAEHVDRLRAWADGRCVPAD
jgi:SpoVK/Ycf46/Vps4 family AAA+-type ATPase